ncbi:MAG TPA: M56 family metallopeptidase [Gemmatales bacterium]|nr:M56 family metallopeptidase [Gemmatales bacterium]
MNALLMFLIFTTLSWALLGLVTSALIRFVHHAGLCYRLLVAVMLLGLAVPLLQTINTTVNGPSAPLFLCQDVDLRLNSNGIETIHQEEFRQPHSAALPWLSENSKGLLVCIYGVGVLMMGAILISRLIRTARFLVQCQPVMDPATLELWRQVADRSPWRDRVRLVTSEEVHYPCCGGYLHPVLVLPECREGLNHDALRWALRHELVHLARRDAWIALLQGIATTLSWFHPAAWWCTSQVNRWREASCDQEVIEHSGSRQSYAHALLGFVERAVVGARLQQPILLQSAGTASQLKWRIQRLALGQGTSPSRLRWSSLLLLSLLLLLAVGQVGFASSLLAPFNRSSVQEKFVELKEVYLKDQKQISRRITSIAR